MKFQLSQGIAAELTLPADPLKEQPMVAFVIPWASGLHRFYAAQVLDAAARGQHFSFGSTPENLDEVRIHCDEVAELAAWVRKQVSPALGSFSVTWAGSDPSLPF